MRKNQLISISALSPGGRQSYVKPSIKVLEMDMKKSMLLTASGGNSNATVTPPTDNSSDDNNTGRGSDYTNPWQ